VASPAYILYHDFAKWQLLLKANILNADKSKAKRKKLNEIMKRNEGVKMATQILQTISRSERERSLYESQLIYELDQRSEKESARRSMQLGIAKNLKLRNIPLDVISEDTGLSLDEVMAL